MSIHNPIEQFEIKTLFSLPQLAGFDVSFTNSALSMVIAVLAASGLLLTASKRQTLIPGRWQAFGEMYFGFIRNLVSETAGQDALKYLPLIFSLFTFVLFGNMLGMFPFAFTFTSHIAVTFALAAFIFIFVTLLGFMKHGLHYFSLFLPHGTPWYIAPILIPIEVFSYLVRPITLSVRLFANMLAGHILLKVLVGFIGMMGLVGGILPLLVTLAIIGLEVFVAFLQAFIFTLLTCVYLKDALNLH